LRNDQARSGWRFRRGLGRSWRLGYGRRGRSGCRLGFNRCWHGRRGLGDWRLRSGLLFLRDELEDVAGLGNMREIDLGFDLVIAAGSARGARAGRGSFGARFKNGAHLLSLVVLERTGVRLLLGDTSFRKNVENCLAFNFQLPSQIVDSNLTHPPYFSSALSR